MKCTALVLKAFACRENQLDAFTLPGCQQSYSIAPAQRVRDTLKTEMGHLSDVAVGHPKGAHTEVPEY